MFKIELDLDTHNPNHTRYGDNTMAERQFVCGMLQHAIGQIGCGGHDHDLRDPNGKVIGRWDFAGGSINAKKAAA